MSTVRRYDFLDLVADAVADYLRPLVGTDITDVCPIVGLTDLMTDTDEADRIIVEGQRATTMPESPGNALVDVNVSIKTLFTQANVKDGTGKATHRDRVNIVFDKLYSENLADDLNAVIADGAGIDFVQRTRQHSRVYPKDGGYALDTLSIGVHAYATELAQPVT